MKRSQIVLFFFLAICFDSFSQKTFIRSSPFGKVKVFMRIEDFVYYLPEANKYRVKSPSAIALITQRYRLAIASCVTGANTRSVNEMMKLIKLDDARRRPYYRVSEIQ